VDTIWKAVLWQQFGASIDMLENGARACPAELWSDRSERPEFWYVVYHTLFFLDLYLSGSVEGFNPPAPFTLDEMDPVGLMPERPFTKDELQNYLNHGRKKCRATIEALTDEKARARCQIPWLEMSFAELLLDNMRHVQHHAAQLNLILRQKTDSAPGWVATTKSKQ
jgi:DinB superfamily